MVIEVENLMIFVECVMVYFELDFEFGYSIDIYFLEFWLGEGSFVIENLFLVYFEGGF